MSIKKISSPRVKKTTSKESNSQLKSFCLEKAMEAYRFSQTKSILELAKEFENYLAEAKQ